jgi:hypothetical protein
MVCSPDFSLALGAQKPLDFSSAASLSSAASVENLDFSSALLLVDVRGRELGLLVGVASCRRRRRRCLWSPSGQRAIGFILALGDQQLLWRRFLSTSGGENLDFSLASLLVDAVVVAASGLQVAKERLDSFWRSGISSCFGVASCRRQALRTWDFLWCVLFHPQVVTARLCPSPPSSGDVALVSFSTLKW